MALNFNHLLLVSILTSSFNANGQSKKDTLRYGETTLNSAVFKGSNWYFDESTAYLENKYIPYDSYYNLAAAIIFSDTAFRKYFQAGSGIPLELSVRDCNIIGDGGTLEKFRKTVGEKYYDYFDSQYGSRMWLEKGLSFITCHSDEPVTIGGLTIPQEYQLNFFESKFPLITLDSVDSPILSFSKDTITGISVENSQIGAFNMASIKAPAHSIINDWTQKFVDSFATEGFNPDYSEMIFFNAGNSSFKTINVQQTREKILSMYFYKCKLEGKFNYSDTIQEISDMDEFISITKKMMTNQPVKSKLFYAEFKDTRINCDFQFGFLANQSTKRFVFENCVFGEDADLRSLDFDTLFIKDCRKILAPLNLNIPDHGTVYLLINNSDLKNISFDYSDHVKFIPDPDQTGNEDLITQSYISLLEKFKAEGKMKSYEHLDVEYKQWYYKNHGILGRIANAVNKSWWYYGYRKGYILYWTFGFLILFTILNYRFWKKFTEVYTISTRDKENYFERINDNTKVFRKGLYVFIITSFIFFSFKVDFEKLNFKKSSMLLYFFLQFVLGLICLFFIANAILKI